MTLVAWQPKSFFYISIRFSCGLCSEAFDGLHFFCFVFSQSVAQSLLRKRLDRTITRPDSAEIIFPEEKQNR
jgi:hypothetical protein